MTQIGDGGFADATRDRQPWLRDDYLLVLDLYVRRGRNSGTNDPEVRELARLLGRTPASISRRLGNFAGTESSGAGGLKPVTGIGREIWDQLRSRPDLLTAEAVATKQRLAGQGGPATAGPSSRGAAADARARILEALRTDLLGPTAEDEQLRERPSIRYVAGILWPEGTELDHDQDEPQPPGDDEEDSSGFEVSVPLVQTLNPSSIGLSVVVATDEEALSVRVEWGEYAREPVGEGDEVGPDGMGFLWRRFAVRPAEVLVPIDPRRRRSNSASVSDDGFVQVQWLTRPLDGVVAVSVFLVNRRPTPTSGTEREERSIFQPKVSVAGSSGRASILGRLPRLLRSAVARELDERASRLLYRDELQFAVGHGCAAGWDRAGPSDRAVLAWTESLPAHEIPALVARDDVNGLELDMGRLAADVTGETLASMLLPLPAAYAAWIDRLEEQIPSLEQIYHEQAAAHVSDCRQALERMEAGIQLLADDAQARRAFRLMNAAMQLQRSQSDWASSFRHTGIRSGSAPAPTGRWRPFQLAFILQCLSGCRDPEHPDRAIADLLWFPTGGGKTEAYLGLAAFVAVLRRLVHWNTAHQGAGVCVLMRYTLRLVTVQQFQRAAVLACALEVLRHRDPSLGEAPFQVGIWVGSRTTPNSFEESDRALTSLAQGQDGDEGSPVQLVSCPWCGEVLTPRHYLAIPARKRTLVGCGRQECEFSFLNRPDGIPVLVVDEEIYRSLPTILIGTVDKFARLPWRGEAQTLFGRVYRYCQRHGWLSPADNHPEQSHGPRGRYPATTVSPTEPLPPPELIVQDELHLIAGPLGSMTGLYEAGIDWLASLRSGDRPLLPKVIASTATIRRASDQVWSLFTRNMSVFPSPGLDHTDSFFAHEVPASTQPGRLHLGVYAPGKSLKTTQVRVFALLLAAAAREHDLNPVSADPYMTLVGYYNSLRELGGAMNLVRDDVRARLRVLAGRGFPSRTIYELKELTSRESSRQIPRTLDQLAVPHRERESGRYPVDVVLATNLISVGVDISRLGLMVVTGQPKATAEYIQATSRVGRSDPGLIVTLYNWSRPRDLSHYERFHAYHAALYRHVEATSVTPFSSRARDRGLHGIYAGMCRVADFVLTPESGAGSFRRDRAAAAEAAEALVVRARAVGGPEVAEAVRRELLARQDRWEQLADGGALRYSWESPHQPPPAGVAILLRLAGTGRDGIWPTPGSLREVEAQAGLFLQEELP